MSSIDIKWKLRPIDLSTRETFTICLSPTTDTQILKTGLRYIQTYRFSKLPIPSNMQAKLTVSGLGDMNSFANCSRIHKYGQERSFIPKIVLLVVTTTIFRLWSKTNVDLIPSFMMGSSLSYFLNLLNFSFLISKIEIK